MSGRNIDRSQYADAVEDNNKRYHANAQLYRKRQEINEHIFGTIKRQWGYNLTNLIGLEKVNEEHSLIMLAVSGSAILSLTFPLSFFLFLILF